MEFETRKVWACLSLRIKSVINETQRIQIKPLPALALQLQVWNDQSTHIYIGMTPIAKVR